MRRCVIVLVGSLGLGLLGSTKVAVAQCGKCQDEGALGPHRFASPGAYFSCPHGNCHPSWIGYACYQTHGAGCGGVTEEDLEQLAAALEAVDVTSLDSALARLTNAQYNSQTGTIDIKCDGTLLARVAVPLPLVVERLIAPYAAQSWNAG